jgi:hypothetical protein
LHLHSFHRLASPDVLLIWSAPRIFENISYYENYCNNRFEPSCWGLQPNADPQG